ncbi:MAG: PAS domain S-box protein [Proteobacteria bacterium]|nr:PAS domain S-box protein [Pseudomonadota bacterium]
MATEQDQRPIARAKSRWRYAILLAANLAFSISLLVGLVGLVQENREKRDISPALTYWSAAQLTLEYSRFLTALSVYTAGDTGVTRDDLETRLDILWSRIAIYDGGVVGEKLVMIDGTADVVAAFTATLRSVEPDVLALAPGDVERFGRVYSQLIAHDLPLYRMAKNTNLYEQRAAIELQAATIRTFWVHTAFLLGIVATGGALVLLLIFEARTTTRSLGVAQTCETRARESEHNVRAIMNTAADAIITTDAKGTILSFNPAAESMFDCKAEEALGRDVSMFIPERHRDAHHEKMVAYLDGDTGVDPRQIRELEALRRDGSTFPIELSLGVTESRNGPTHVSFIRDITARKQAQEQIHHSQKMDALGQLTGGVAHEFNNLLTAISGFSEMARRKPGDADHVDQCLTEVVNASTQAAEQICRRPPASDGRRGMLPGCRCRWGPG